MTVPREVMRMGNSTQSAAGSPHEYGIMRPATRLARTGVGLAAVRVLVTLERLCYF
jgi:hypothetical protein